MITWRLTFGAALRAVCIICPLLLSVPGGAQKIADIRATGYVTDLANVIDPGSKQRIETLCADVDQRTGAQIAVVTVSSLEGETKEQYAVDLYKHLGVGSKKDDRGVLLLLAPQERQYRIEVGYGLEPVITDARAGDIGRSMVPLLRQGKYPQAAENAVRQLADLVGGGATARPPPRRRPGSSGPSWLWILFVLLFFGLPWVLQRAVRSATSGPRRRGSSGSWWLGSGAGWGGGFGGSSGGFSSGGFGGFGGGLSGGGGAGGSW